ncbi:MAG: M56/M15 family metallopeptidase [Psychroserpens sp.]|uniref:N-acetylmuramoyl-L-alanine amidase n=1 Tax=Psychroserpens sp. TaxID=2020870 RepID=UPI003C75B6BE
MAPLLEVTTFETVPSITEMSFQSSEEKGMIDMAADDSIVTALRASRMNFANVFWFLYLAISSFVLFRFVRNLYKIIKLTRQSHSCLGILKIVERDDHENASSFLNYLFIDSETLKDLEQSSSIVQHELVHCMEKHTLDVIFMELLLCFFWYNPFLWMYRQAIAQNHEFIADEQTIASGIPMETYARAIIKSSQKEYRVPLTSGFNFIQIKNRIIMLHQSKSSVPKQIFKITSVILLFACIFIFSCTDKDLNTEPLTVIIDAGHGGIDSGNFIKEQDEKFIVLQITKALAALSDQRVDIVLTRNKDEFMSLKDRAEFVNSKKPDLFLSLHCNASKNSLANGVEAYIDLNHEDHDKMLHHAELLLQNQTNYFTSRGVKTGNFYLLKNTSVPSVILELGFLTNDGDRNLLFNTNQQKNIAQSIYDSLLEIRALKS